MLVTLASTLGSPARAEALRAEKGAVELTVKATYLYKLAPFVSWPPGVYSAPNAPLVICVQGADPFGVVLDRVTSGQAVGAHPVIVRRLAKLDPDAGCEIAYLAGGPAQSQAQALQAVEGQPVLTVTDEATGTPARGIVHLRLEAGKVRFSIDTGQAEVNGVAISSKLLALAVRVKR
ncbi:MAG TPA: YfiR family protein [Phenylobacterium sp.]|nr:YfiR family protein [Phenylobacterium sp.]